MFVEERKRKILEILNKSGRVTVNELSKKFSVSKPTIRRDLHELEEELLLVRSHGGAVQKETSKYEPTFIEKLERNFKEKQLIGKCAAAMIEMGDTILLDSGTTTLNILPYITAKDVTIITNSLRIIQELVHIEKIDFIAIGGFFKPRTEAFVGPLAVNTLNNLFIDKAFIGANGLSIENGITTPDLIEAETKRAMIKRSESSYIVADHSKFNKIAFSKIVEFSEINGIIVDSGVSEKVIEEYKENNITLIIARDEN